MSTMNKQRALKIALVLLGVSSIATVGISLSYGAMDGDSNQMSEPNEKIVSTEALNEESSPSEEAKSTLLADEEKLKSKIIALEKEAEKQENISTSSEYANLQLPNADKYIKVKVTATGYTAGVESTGKDPSHPEYGITYSGVYVRRDAYSTIAADISVFPLGTVLFIPGYGYGVVTDTGSAIKGNKIDLYFETVDDVYSQWGKKQVDVYVIKRGDGAVNEAVLDQYNNESELAKTAM